MQASHLLFVVTQAVPGSSPHWRLWNFSAYPVFECNVETWSFELAKQRRLIGRTDIRVGVTVRAAQYEEIPARGGFI